MTDLDSMADPPGLRTVSLELAMSTKATEAALPSLGSSFYGYGSRKHLKKISQQYPVL